MRKLLRSCFSRKALAVSAFVLAAIATLYVAFRTFERWRAEQAWRAYEQAAEARGTRLWAKDYLPVPVPPAEDFAATPIFQEVFKTTATPRPLELSGTRPRIGDLDNGRSTVLAEWQDYFVKQKLLESPPADPARGVLMALQRYAAPLQEISLAARRPHSAFPVRWEQGFAATMPHLTTIMDAARLLALRATAHLAAGDPAAALADAQTLLAIYHVLRQEPVLITGLVRISIVSMAQAVVAEGFAADAWTDEQLRALRPGLATVNLLEDLVFSLASERAVMNSTLGALPDKSARELASLITTMTGPVPPAPSAGAIFACSLYPSGWLIQSQLKMNEMFDSAIARIDLAAGRMRTLERDPAEELMRSSIPRRFYYLLAAVSMPAVLSVEKRCVAAQARAQQAAAACALELFRHANGHYPERLEEIVPQFAAALPIDPADGAPQRYRRTDTGGYLLWSLGANGTDDGGKTVEKKSAKDQPDWVWRR